VQSKAQLTQPRGPQQLHTEIFCACYLVDSSKLKQLLYVEVKIQDLKACKYAGWYAKLFAM
jgi:hypothetical protein